jgi:hypothetical protein
MVKHNKAESLNVPIRRSGRREYVRMNDIPEPYLTAFKKALYVAQVPVVEGEGECAYAADWIFFLERNGLR